MSGAYQTLISAEALHAHLGQPGWVVLDCRFDLASPSRAAQDIYPAGHIPGAWFADLERDLSGPITGRTGRHPLPSPGHLVEHFSAWGIAPGTQVVAYDDNSGYAARTWWSLRYMGHLAAAVLDGGLAAWIGRGYPLSTEAAAPSPGRFQGAPHPDLVVASDRVLEIDRLLDARAPERYRGEIEPIDRVPGHIPGAVNYPWATSLGEDGRHLEVDQLRRRLQAALGTTAPSDAAAYCGSGVTACNIILAMEHAGLAGVRLYPGSWSEWCSDPSRPIETGQHDPSD